MSLLFNMYQNWFKKFKKITKYEWRAQIHWQLVVVPAELRTKRMVGGLQAFDVPWQAMVFLSENFLDGGYAGGALISDRWVLTAGRNLFVRRDWQHTRGRTPNIPKVYLGISSLQQANRSNEYAVEKVRSDVQVQINKV